MDPRMDSGIERQEYPKGTFNPYAPLLPEEVCWIIDRTFAAEVRTL
jgi:N-alpha-acetyltransferase 35, NatC auxiliary subunit